MGAKLEIPNVRKITIAEFLKTLKKANQELRLVYKFMEGWKERIDSQWVWRRIIFCNSPFPHHNVCPEGIVYRYLFPGTVVPVNYRTVSQLIGLSERDAEMVANAVSELCKTKPDGSRVRFSRKLREDLLEACALREIPFSERPAPAYGQPSV